MRKLYAVPFILLMSAFQVQAQPTPECVTSGGVLSIINLGNVEVKTQCCAGLEVEMIGNDEVCFKKDDSPVDSSLQTCANDGGCSNGKGCFVQTSEDLFSAPLNSTEEEAQQAQMQDQVDFKIETILGEDGEPKNNGTSCTYHAECESYNCEATKIGEKYVKSCKEKKICRLAQEDETAQGSVECEEELYKDEASICKSKTDGVYLGLLGDVEIQEDPANKCKMNIPDNAKAMGLAAMKALRSMEYVFANITDGGVTDCLRYIKPVLRDEIGKTLSAKRKEIVQQFNEGWALINQDYKTILEAQQVDAASANMVTLHNIDGQPVQVQDGAIKSRSSSGFDMLIMMKRRNILFKNYEEKMKLAVQEAFNDIKALEGSMANSFGQHSRSWTVNWYTGSKHYEKGDVSCKSGFLGIGSGKRKKVRKRYGKYFKVAGAHNATLVSRELIMKSLAQMADGSMSTAKNDFTKGSYLLDPLIPQGVSAGVQSSLWLSIGSLPTLRNDLPKGVISYLKTFNPENKKEYLYEPELVAITDGEVNKQEEMATCLNSPQALADQKCAKLNAFVQDISDVSLAQIYAFSRKGSKNYRNFFNNTTSWRRRLLNYYSVNYANLVSYYTALGQYREKQNNCIDERLGLVNTMIEGGGYNPGLANNYWDPNQYLNENTSSAPVAGGQIKNNLAVNHNFSGFSGATNQLQNSGSLKDNIASTGSNTGAGSVNSTGSANFAANIKAMNEANKKNMSSAELEQKSKDVMDSIKSIGGSSSSSMASLGSGIGGTTSSAMGGMSGGAKLGDDLKGEADKKDGSGKGEGLGAATSGSAAGANTAGAGSGIAGGFANGMSGITSGSSSGLGSADASEGASSYQDPTGMSDEEKDRLMANYERTKSQYSPNENDSLFKVVSKAYVRNLEKVLTKKKKTLESTK